MHLTDEQQQEYIRLITQNQRAVHSYIMTMVRHSSIADDILQETNLVLWNKFDEYNPNMSFRAWACRIGYYQTLTYLNKERRRKKATFSEELLDTLAEETESLFNEYDERYTALTCCVGKLSEVDREILRHRYHVRMPLAEYAEIVGRSEGALKQALFRIRHTLRRCIRLTMSEQGTTTT
jgi:RNA polymerase sigma-70 factor (ECF subfamily)